MYKIIKFSIVVALAIFATSCIIEEHSVRSYYPHYYNYYVKPAPRPMYAPNPYYIPPRPVYRPKPIYRPKPHNTLPPMRPGYNYKPRPNYNTNTRPSTPTQTRPQQTQTKPSMPHNNIQRGPSPYSNQKSQR